MALMVSKAKLEGLALTDNSSLIVGGKQVYADGNRLVGLLARNGGRSILMLSPSHWGSTIIFPIYRGGNKLRQVEDVEWEAQRAFRAPPAFQRANYHSCDVPLTPSDPAIPFPGFHPYKEPHEWPQIYGQRYSRQLCVRNWKQRKWGIS